MSRGLQIAAILGGAVILLIPALLNGFPFLFPDSGDYLVFTPRLDRSPYYGLFIFFFHLNHFIWAPLFAQSLIVSGLIWLLLGLHDVPQKNASFLAIVVFLTVFSSLPFFTGFIMADIFTPVMFLAMYMIGFHYEKFSRLQLTGLLLLDCVATVAHISNLTMSLGMLALFALLLATDKTLKRDMGKRLGLVAIPAVLAAAAIFLYNGVIFGFWSLSPAGETFLLANLLVHGPALAYLKDVCPDAGYKPCAYTDLLSHTKNEFVWATDILDHVGGFPGIANESKQIVRGTLAHYPGAIVRMIANNFLQGLLIHEPGAEFYSSTQIPSMIDLLKIKFGPAALASYLGSAEMRDTIPHGLIGATDRLVTPVMFFALVGLGLYAANRRSRTNTVFAAIVVIAVLGNTLFCTAVSGIHDRYQARVTWLLPLAVFIIVFSLMGPNSRKDGVLEEANAGFAAVTPRKKKD